MKGLTKKQLLPWFIGFAEGDGSWNVDEQNKRSIFIIHQKDPQILYKIKRLLKFGTITGPYTNKNGSTYYRYRVGTLKGTQELINIFNGNLVLNKTRKRFKKYLDCFNLRANIRGTSSMVLFNDNSILPTLKDGWLSGFIDAEGSFSGTVLKRGDPKIIKGVKVRFSIVQKDEKEIFEYLKSILGGSLQHEIHKNAYRLLLESIKDRKTIMDYLDKFPLHSNKSIPFARFKKIHVRLTDGNFKWRLESPRAKERMINLVKNINKDI